MTPIRCPRCSWVQRPMARFCHRCGAAQAMRTTAGTGRRLRRLLVLGVIACVAIIALRSSRVSRQMTRSAIVEEMSTTPSARTTPARLQWTDQALTAPASEWTAPIPIPRGATWEVTCDRPVFMRLEHKGPAQLVSAGTKRFTGLAPSLEFRSGDYREVEVRVRVGVVR